MDRQWKNIASIIAREGGDASLINQDLKRVSEFYYGPFAQPLTPNPVCVFIGMKSGLEVEFIYTTIPNAKIFIIEPNKSHYSYNDSRFTFVQSLDQLVTALKERGLDIIAYCRIDKDMFDDRLLDSLSSASINILYLCGEYCGSSSTNLQLHRSLSRIASKFFIRLKGGDFVLTKRDARFQKYVSVIVPAYGVESYLDKCLESLVNQTIEDIEIIVVDDGAKDRSGYIADRWAELFPDKVLVIHKENGGCASARNSGLSRASGLYVGFVDGDDWVSPHMFEDLINAALLNTTDIAQCGFKEVYDDGSEKSFPSLPIKDGRLNVPYITNNTHDFLFNPPSIWRRIYRKEFLSERKISFAESLPRFDDLPFAFMALTQCNSVAIIPECHYSYRLGRPGQDVSFDDERLYIMFDIFEMLRNYAKESKDNNIMRSLEVIERSHHNWALERLRKDLIAEYRMKMDTSKTHLSATIGANTR